MQQYVNQMSAEGGGDGPESVTEALWEALNLPWRKESAKVVVLISDAPPHGLGENGDGFPDGDPTGRDPLEIAHQMARQGIVVYAVGVEPNLSGYQHARDFMMALAQITEGQFLPLTNANLLATVVIGGAVEEVSMAQLMDQVRIKSEQLESEGLEEEQVKVKVAEWMQEQNVETNQLEVDDIYGQSYNFANRDALAAATDLRSVKGKLELALNPGVGQSSRRRASYGDDEECDDDFAADEAECCDDEDKVCRKEVRKPSVRLAAWKTTCDDDAPSHRSSEVLDECESQSATWSKKKISVTQAYKMHSRYMKSKK